MTRLEREDYDEMSPQCQELYNALIAITDEIMSTLHAGQLSQPTVDSSWIVEELRGLYDMAEEGMGREAHFRSLNRPILRVKADTE